MYRKRDVVGCVYPKPVADAGKELPEDFHDLRAFQVREMCPTLVGLPVFVSHKAGASAKEAKGADPVLGNIPLGKVVDSWIDPSTGAMHWRGSLVVERGSMLDTLIDGRRLFNSCSLAHVPATATSAARAVEVSVCTNPLRKGSVVHYDGDVPAYMRKTNHPHYVDKMSTVPATTPAATATPMAVEEQQTQQTQPPTLQQGEQAPQPTTEQMLMFAHAEMARMDSAMKEKDARLAEFDKQIHAERESLLQLARNIIGENAVLNNGGLVAASQSSSADAQALWPVIGLMTKNHAEQQQQLQQLQQQVSQSSAAYGRVTASATSSSSSPSLGAGPEIAELVSRTANGARVNVPADIRDHMLKRMRTQGYFREPPATTTMSGMTMRPVADTVVRASGASATVPVPAAPASAATVEPVKYSTIHRTVAESLRGIIPIMDFTATKRQYTYEVPS